MTHIADIPAVVPAAGHGTRMRPLCGERPKELLPVAGRAAIEHALLEALGAGMKRVAVVVRPGKPLIEAFLQGGRPETLREWRYAARAVDYRQRFEELRFVEQPEASGVADAIARARRALGAEAVACLLPDNVALSPRPPIAACLESWRATGLTTLAAIKVKARQARRFANCGGLEVARRPDGRLAVRAIQNKGPGPFHVGPEGAATRAVGRAVLAPRFFELFEEGLDRRAAGGELDDVPIYQALAAAGQLLAAPVEGDLFDTGHTEGYEAALEFMADGPSHEPGPS